jgi:hypothetical protein
MMGTSHVETGESRATNGPSEICLNIADIIIALKSADTSLTLHLAGPVSEFAVKLTASAPDIHITVDWADSFESEGAGRQLFDSGSTWQLYELPSGSREFRLSAPFSGWQPYKLARFSRDWTSGEILCQRRYFADGESIYPLEYPLDEALLTNLLAMGRGVEIHACALKDADGRGYLFPGQSGAGKSTTAGLWAVQDGVRILSDERVILREHEGRIKMYGTPWHGDARLGGPLSATLDAIYFLGRGESNDVVPVGRAEAAARLFACSFPPFYSASGLAFTLEFLEQVTGLALTSELKFVPDERVIDFVRERASV